MDFERRNPTKGDPSWRRLQANATSQTIDANHLHIDTGYILRDRSVAPTATWATRRRRVQ